MVAANVTKERVGSQAEVFGALAAAGALPGGVDREEPEHVEVVPSALIDEQCEHAEQHEGRQPSRADNPPLPHAAEPAVGPCFAQLAPSSLSLRRHLWWVAATIWTMSR